MRWCVFPERRGTSSRMIPGDSGALRGLLNCFACTHTVHCHYCWRVSRSTLLTNHCSLLGTAGAGRRIRANTGKNNGKHQSAAEWKTRIWKKDKRKTTMRSFRVQIGERRRRQSGIRKPTWRSDWEGTNIKSYRTQTALPRRPWYEIPWLFHDFSIMERRHICALFMF